MLDHIGVPVTDIEKSRAFYDRALAPLGLKRMMDIGADNSPLSSGHVASGYGDGKRFSFWIDAKPAVQKLHFAFVAETRATVDAFYKAAMAAGGRDNGVPGLRPHYHKDYYGAFVLDPDGHNAEAVCRKPE